VREANLRPPALFALSTWPAACQGTNFTNSDQMIRYVLQVLLQLFRQPRLRGILSFTPGIISEQFVSRPVNLCQCAD